MSFSPVAFGERRTLASDRGTCAQCGRAFGVGADVFESYSRTQGGADLVHARAHVACPWHLRLVSSRSRAA